MTARYWFRPKRYGCGATPVTWEGWLVALISAALIAAAVGLLVIGRPSGVAMLGGVAAVVAIVIATVAVSQAKTEGGWKWRWGDQ